MNRLCQALVGFFLVVVGWPTERICAEYLPVAVVVDNYKPLRPPPPHS